MNCDDLFTEVDASASFQAEVVNGAGQSLVTTIVQGLAICLEIRDMDVQLQMSV